MKSQLELPVQHGAAKIAILYAIEGTGIKVGINHLNDRSRYTTGSLRGQLRLFRKSHIVRKATKAQQTEMVYQIYVVCDAVSLARLLPNQSVHYCRQEVWVERVVTD